MCTPSGLSTLGAPVSAHPGLDSMSGLEAELDRINTDELHPPLRYKPRTHTTKGHELISPEPPTPPAPEPPTPPEQEAAHRAGKKPIEAPPLGPDYDPQYRFGKLDFKIQEKDVSAGRVRERPSDGWESLRPQDIVVIKGKAEDGLDTQQWMTRLPGDDDKEDMRFLRAIPKSVVEKMTASWKKDIESKAIKKIEYPSFDAEAAAPKPEASTIEKQGMDVLDTASELLDARDKKKELQIQEWNKLPLLKPSVVCYTREEVKNGFRVDDGYTVSFHMSSGNVRVSTERQKPFVDGKFNYFVEKWTEGLAWCYWSDSFRNSKGEDLEYCIMHYGMGGWHKKEKDIRAKVIFTNDKRSGDPGDCFVLAMDRPIAGCQIRNKQQDENVNVDKVHRSNVPDSLQKIISLRELVNVRDGHEFASFWYM